MCFDHIHFKLILSGFIYYFYVILALFKKNKMMKLFDILEWLTGVLHPLLFTSFLTF